MIIPHDYAVAAKRVLTAEAANHYLAGDATATDEAGHELIAEEASRVCAERMEATTSRPGTAQLGSTP